MNNHQIASLLREVAAVFDIKDKDFFRSRAYRNAADSLDNLEESLSQFSKHSKLTDIPGIGETLARHLQELIDTGKVKHFQTELKRVPQGMFALMAIRGIGPKTAFKIATKFALKDRQKAVSKFKILLKNHKLRSLPGFAEKLEQKLAVSLDNNFQKKTRILISDAFQTINPLIDYLQTADSVVAVEALGSLRRRMYTVGDLDLGVCSSNFQKTLNALLKYQEINKVISSGSSLSRIKLKNGYEVDVKFAKPTEWGNLLHHYTGSRSHNIQLRSIAQKNNLSISEHGIKDLSTGKQIRNKDEHSFFNFLKLQFIPAEIREGDDELELARHSKLPNLIDLSDIKGDLHIHSDYQYPSSHDLGQSTLESYLEYAISHRYQYLGITDHNPKTTGLSKTETLSIITKRKSSLFTQYSEYENDVKKSLPKMFVGLEADIKTNGTLTVSEDILDQLDYCIVSIHSQFQLDSEQNTKRILTALKHPKVKILGHPTGRLYPDREPIAADWPTIFQYCSANKKVLEINASPARTDLPDDLIRLAAKAGCLFSINSDSHNQKQMDQIKYGVWNARRGWCQKQSCINTWNHQDLIRLLK